MRRMVLAGAVFVGTALVLESAARISLGDRFVAGVITDLPMNACVTYNANLGWVNRPGLRARAIGPTLEYPVFEYSVSISSVGFRDREHEPSRRPGVFRILSLGDSVAWGWGVDQGECYADLLQQRLGSEVEVINMGVPGYSTDQEYLALLDHALSFPPDLVILGYVLNDAEGNLLDFNYGLGKPRLVQQRDRAWAFANQPVRNSPEGAELNTNDWSTWMRAHSALIQFLQPPIVSRPRDPDVEFPQLPEENLEKFFRAYENKVYTEQQIKSLSDAVNDPTSPTHELLRRLKRDCDKLGASLLVFSVPHHHDQYLLISELDISWDAHIALREGREFKTYLTRQLETAAATIGFETLSVDHALLEATRKGTNLNVGDGHPTATGHEIIANQLEGWIKGKLGDLRKDD